MAAFPEYMKKLGFTLIEMLMVSLVIGILSAVAIPQYRRAVQKADSVQALAMLKTLYDSSERLAGELGYKDVAHMIEHDSTRSALNRMDMFGSSNMPKGCSIGETSLHLKCAKFIYQVKGNSIDATQRTGSMAGTVLTFNRANQTITCTAPQTTPKACDVYGF